MHLPLHLSHYNGSKHPTVCMGSGILFYFELSKRFTKPAHGSIHSNLLPHRPVEAPAVLLSNRRRKYLLSLKESTEPLLSTDDLVKVYLPEHERKQAGGLSLQTLWKLMLLLIALLFSDMAANSLWLQLSGPNCYLRL